MSYYESGHTGHFNEFVPLSKNGSFFKNWANPGLFLFIFIIFNNNFTEKIVDFSGNRTRIVGVEGEHADH